MNNDQKKQLDEYLESAMDRYGLEQVLERLADLARSKEWHVKENWQDNLLADRWAEIASALEVAHEHARELRL